MDEGTPRTQQGLARKKGSHDQKKDLVLQNLDRVACTRATYAGDAMLLLLFAINQIPSCVIGKPRGGALAFVTLLMTIAVETLRCALQIITLLAVLDAICGGALQQDLRESVIDYVPHILSFSVPYTALVVTLMVYSGVLSKNVNSPSEARGGVALFRRR